MRIWSFAFVALILGAGCRSVPDPRGGAALQDVADFWVKEMKCPECTIADCTADRVVFAGDPGRMYRIGSLTKFYMELVLFDLAKRGVVDLDRPVADYSKLDLPTECAHVTLRDLAEHRSGLPREFMNFWLPVNIHRALACGLWGAHIYASFESKEDFVVCINDERYRAMMREREVQYSNPGFGLLVMTLEDVTGKSIEALLKDYLASRGIFSRTAFEPTDGQRPFVTEPCAGKLPWLVRKGEPVDPHPLGPALRGAGALLSSADDCVRMFRLYRQEVMGGQAFDVSLSSFRDGDMCRLFRVRQTASGRKYLYRFGFVYGGQTFMAYDPASDRLLVIFRNVTSWPASEDLDTAERLFGFSS